ncbi:MAG: hypothetical protein NTW07_01105 [candidate division Zixibacteria bacterium]|nr:hypothetical protein [candidate division Zixibacteria bacterium]
MLRANLQPWQTFGLCLLIINLPFSVKAMDLGPGEPCMAVKLGRLNGATAVLSRIGVEGREIRITSASSLGLSLDFALTKHLYAGAVLDWHMRSNKYYLESRSAQWSSSTLELGAQLKWLISFGDGRYALRPGIGIGGGTGNYELLTLRASAEFQASVSDQNAIGLESGVWYVPVGTDDVYDIRIRPTFYLRAEFLFSIWSEKRSSLRSRR